MYAIVKRQSFSENSFLWDVLAPDVAASAQPGHFVMLRLREGGERIPLTVADFDRKAGTVTIVVQSLGRTTREMRDEFAQGDRFDDFVGPLGLPQHIGKFGHVVLVGGGLGVAPIYPQLRAFIMSVDGVSEFAFHVQMADDAATDAATGVFTRTTTAESTGVSHSQTLQLNKARNGWVYRAAATATGSDSSTVTVREMFSLKLAPGLNAYHLPATNGTNARLGLAVGRP